MLKKNFTLVLMLPALAGCGVSHTNAEGRNFTAWTIFATPEVLPTGGATAASGTGMPVIIINNGGEAPTVSAQ